MIPRSSAGGNREMNSRCRKEPGSGGFCESSVKKHLVNLARVGHVR
jgi:hypothetical protein